MDEIEDIRRRMDAAAAAMDFEEAARLRDRLSVMRGNDGGDPVDTAGLVRQQPGSMGLGTSRQRVEPPPGWTPPPRPDLMVGKRGRPRKPAT